MPDVIFIPSVAPVDAPAATASAVPTGAAVPVPRLPVTVRAGAAGDLPFIDGLQKAHSYMVGWMPRKQVEEKVAAGDVLVAEDERHAPVGYIIAHDQYMKRDDVGIIYQVNVQPMRQRHLVGASLVRAAFERAAYGCRLYCCWCAQDIRANFFWESLGFVPLAFRTGARGQQRTHILWQRRVRAGDETTPYWFPAETNGGSMREGRIVLPIPPGTHWRDPMPLLLPEVQTPIAPVPKALPPTRPPAPAVSVSRRMAIVRSQSKHLMGVPPGKAAVLTAGGIRYIERGDYEPEPPPPPRPKRPAQPRAKNDRKHLALARELRDRYLEQVNGHGGLLSTGKYDVSRPLAAACANAEALQVSAAVPAAARLPHAA